MSEKKELSNEELEKATGGDLYFGWGTPTIENFTHATGSVCRYSIYTSLDPNSSSVSTHDLIVKGHAIKRGGAVSFGGWGSYSMYYKFQFVDRQYAAFDGWYDSIPTGAGVQRAPSDIIILDEID